MRLDINEDAADKLREAATELNISASALISLVIDITLSREGVKEFKRIFYCSMYKAMQTTVEKRFMIDENNSIIKYTVAQNVARQKKAP